MGLIPPTRFFNCFLLFFCGGECQLVGENTNIWRLILERISDSEIEHEAVAPEPGDVVIAAASGVVWRMDGDADVEPDDYRLIVEAQAHSRSECYLFQECLRLISKAVLTARLLSR